MTRADDDALLRAVADRRRDSQFRARLSDVLSGRLAWGDAFPYRAVVLTERERDMIAYALAFAPLDTTAPWFNEAGEPIPPPYGRDDEQDFEALRRRIDPG